MDRRHGSCIGLFDCRKRVRGHAAKLFKRRRGILVSDRAKALNFWPMKRRQICWSHLLRKFVAFSERDGPAGRIGQQLVDTTAVLFETHRNWRECIISRRVFHQRMAPVRKQIEALLRQAVGAKIARLSGSCQDILDHQQALWTFVDRRGVDPTNNHAYAARGISMIMPRPGLCRVAARQCSRLDEMPLSMGAVSA
jgi:hypothetical protein